MKQASVSNFTLCEFLFRATRPEYHFWRMVFSIIYTFTLSLNYGVYKTSN